MNEAMEELGNKVTAAVEEYTNSVKEKIEDDILDEKMREIDKMISDFIGKRIKLPMNDKPEIEEDPINYEPLVRQIRDFARGNAYGNRILDRAIAHADEAIALLSKKDKNDA